MRDLIDERNFREKCSRSIVKGYNVHYMTQEEIDAQNKAKQEKEAAAPKETRRRYKSEEKALDAALELYGMDPNDPVTREQIEQILGEREDNFMANLMSAVQSKELEEQEMQQADAGVASDFTGMVSEEMLAEPEEMEVSTDTEMQMEPEGESEPIVIEEVVNV